MASFTVHFDASLQQVIRVNTCFGEAFRHLVLLIVKQHTVRLKSHERGLVTQNHRRDEAAKEPARVLVTAFQR